MGRPVADWTEDDVLALPPGENDGFERKGSKKLDLTLPEVKEGEVLDELAKQLSAFANAGGGQIVYGLTNFGVVDNGGVARSVKGSRSTKEWLEDLIPTLTDFEILGFNVYEVLPKADASKIAEGKSLYVIDVPDSDRAPHQSTRDRKYYVRLGGNSLPASHRLLEDIRNRLRHPVLDVTKIEFEVLELPEKYLPSVQGAIRCRLHFLLKNQGRLMARNTCLNVELPAADQFAEFEGRTVSPRGVGPEFWEITDPVYPGMEIGFWVNALLAAHFMPPCGLSPFGSFWQFRRGLRDADVRLLWRLFADNAPTKEGSVTLKELGFDTAARRAIDRHPRAGEIQDYYQLF